jgi:ABC-type multidrug transport system fused ATPase/permease subunit
VKDRQLTERGTHEQLLAAGGFYSELYNIQFGEQEAAV